MTAKFTPGPWVAVGAWVEHTNDNVADICNCDPGAVGQSHLGRSDDEVCANARLIAAAPDLFKALKKMCLAYVRLLETGRDVILLHGGDCDPVDKMEASDPSLTAAINAIAKATGRVYERT